MAFHTSGDNVIYSSPTWTEQFQLSDVALGDTLDAVGTTTGLTTNGTLSDLSVAIGKYERIIGTWKGFYNSDNANELYLRIRNKSSANAAVATTIKQAVTAIVGTIGNTGAAAGADLEGGVQYSTTGTGQIIKIDSGSDDTPLYFSIDFTAIVTVGTQGTLEFQAANVGDSAGESDILTGSYISYRRF